MADTDKRSTAYHEAGHAVVGRVLGLKCGPASIIADDAEGEAGHAICADPYAIWDHWEQRGRFRDLRTAFLGRILAYMAGAEAEQEFFGRCAVGDNDDRYQIAMMADADMPHMWDSREPRMRVMTRTLIRRHRDKIERVAVALLERSRLTAEELDAICADPL